MYPPRFQAELTYEGFIARQGDPTLKDQWRGLSKEVLNRVIIGVTPFRVLIPLCITYLLSPLTL